MSKASAASAVAATVPTPPTPATPALRVNWLLELSDPRQEKAFREQQCGVERLGDQHIATLVLLVAAISLPAAAGRTLSAAAWPSLLLGAVVGGQSVALLALARLPDATYARWRGTVVAAGRVLRVLVWVATADTTPLCSLCWTSGLASHLLLLPAVGSSAWFALFQALPLRAHVLVQGATTAIVLWHSRALCARMAAVPSIAAHAGDLFQRIHRLFSGVEAAVQLITPPSAAGGLVDAAALSAQDALWCVFAFMVVLAFLLPIVALFWKETHGKVRFVSLIVAAPSASVVRTSICMTSSMVTLLVLSCIPVCFTFLALMARYVVHDGFAMPGLALVITSAALDVFMRVWVLTACHAGLVIVLRVLSAHSSAPRDARTG